MRQLHDPMEQLIQEGLTAGCFRYSTDEGGGTSHNLDFHLPDFDVAIEVKRMHSPRISAQPDVAISEGWQPIKTAPYSTPVEVKLGHMTIIASLWRDASLTDEEMSCDQWLAEYDGEHPECWSGGACWSSNADEAVSMQPEAWRPLPTAPKP